MADQITYDHPTISQLIKSLEEAQELLATGFITPLTARTSPVHLVKFGNLDKGFAEGANLNTRWVAALAELLKDATAANKQIETLLQVLDVLQRSFSDAEDLLTGTLTEYLSAVSQVKKYQAVS